MQVRLILLSGSRVGDEVRIEEEAILGRSPECQLRLDDAGVSRRHARVRVEDESVWLEDLGSSNGTKVGGRRVQEVRVDDGDVFELAKVKVRVKIAGAGPSIAPPANDGFEELDLDAMDIPPAPEVSTPDVTPRSAPPPSPPDPAPVVEVRGRSAPEAPVDQTVVKQAKSGGYVPRVAPSRRAGVLGEDLSQQSGAPKVVLVLVVVAAAAGVFWLVFTSMR